MAEDLDDGEFWLPSHFLTDDDILMDFDFSAPKLPEKSGFFGYGLSSSNSDLELTSGCTETESDEEDILLAGLTRKMARSELQDSSCPVHSKGYVLSSSPQSTLCGCLCNHGSSRESLSGPVSPPQPPPQNADKDTGNNKENNNSATLDLLNKAAGEVARLKLKTEKSTGTGFFDCSQKGVLYPSPMRNPDHFPPIYYQPRFHHFSPMVWAPSNGVQYNQGKQQQPQPLLQNRATNNNNNNKSNSMNNNNRPLGLPPSAWPTLQQVQAQNQAHPMPPQPMLVGPKRESNGTGVFLPRSVTTTPSLPRKKSDGNATKSSKTGKGSQSQSSHRRNGRTTTTPTPTPTPTPTVNNNEIQLPQEWTY